MSMFKQVDVFTNTKFKGNPVAVFFDADHLSKEEMQQIARWTNLSETTFILKPSTPATSYKVRIFTPATELSFAGHPTLGTCFALLEAKRIQVNSKGLIVQECGAGNVEIEPIGNLEDLNSIDLQLRVPRYDFHQVSDEAIEDISQLLGLPKDQFDTPVLVEIGPKWVVVRLKDGQSVLDLEPNHGALTDVSIKYGWTGLCTIGQHNDEGTKWEMRNFAPAEMVPEDPACGSGAGALGAYLGVHQKGGEGVYHISQGNKINRDAHLVSTVKPRVDSEGFDVFVKGHAITTITGFY
ncbi:uncharacterized protein KQ657_001159 [Scheffersomyces spartinae]|uniref:Uncharacterized protein n=1 Tax=Scheffersomyces spartinae TaxID=45513 RepID=A0A9P7V7X4_9ASCO|nr:uncharacterized protein KQ657_001159 [Scheffersomyces spartinae]KAG7193044.1 hypothetical protein KQ657_001159 [Scheffersomyces spartinae]